MAKLTRRQTLAAVTASLPLAFLPFRPALASAKQFTIGYQAGTVTLVLGKAKQAFETKLAPLGWRVAWAEFTSGPPMLEALAAGAINFACTGEPPVIFAQAAGTPLVYVAATHPNPKTIAILKPKGSTLASVAALRGKKVAVARGSSAHYLLVSALAHAGVPYEDVTKVFLQPADALAAFSVGAVDAWSVWDPYYATAQQDGAVVLTDGTGLMPNRGFYSSGQGFAAAHPDVLNAAIEVLNGLESWSSAHQAAASKLVAPIIEIWFARQRYGVTPLNPEIFAAQQKIADAFYKLNLIPRQINVAADAWTSRS